MTASASDREFIEFAGKAAAMYWRQFMGDMLDVHVRQMTLEGSSDEEIARRATTMFLQIVRSRDRISRLIDHEFQSILAELEST